MGNQEDTGETREALEQPAHSLPFEQVLKLLNADPVQGLSKAELETRRGTYGDNALEEGPGVQPWRILVHQVANALTLVSPMASANADNETCMKSGS